MLKFPKASILLLCLFSLFSCESPTNIVEIDVLVIGGGTGGVAAGIQAARMGVTTLISEETPWLGGMLTAAGVTATDGNHQLPSGLWGEFRQHLLNHYGGPQAVSTGWVSHTLFEPGVGAEIFQNMTEAESNLEVWLQSEFIDLKLENGYWEVKIQKGARTEVIHAKIVIDGTDLGDIAAKAGTAYDVGMDSRQKTGESIAPDTGNDIIQDFTYVAILKDYGPDADKTIQPGPDYDPNVFTCACAHQCDDEKAHPCATMLDYAKLPNGKYMINWPIFGNDYYANMVEMSKEEREKVYENAKAHTLNFVYYIQHELGFKNLGLADDEFPTDDQLALIPYHREGRRIHGLCQLKLGHILDPFAQPEPLYRTGIAVGDYPIDHHHQKNTNAPEIDFPPVPSFNVPLGSLVPQYVDRLIMADKAISITNIVNGSTRLQPVVLQIGQAAGALAALAVEANASPRDISIREVQDYLLQEGVFLLPYLDVQASDSHFGAIQRIGATGILRGTGIPYKWANQTWFYPDTTITKTTLLKQLQEFEPGFQSILLEKDNDHLLISEALSICAVLSNEDSDDTLTSLTEEAEASWDNWGLYDYNIDRPITKRELAVMLDNMVGPFLLKMVDWNGNWL